jgi:methylmalonyl-CoA mutase
MPTLTDPATASTDSLTIAFAQWKKAVEAELKGASFDKKLVTRTFEGLPLQPLYTRADLAGLPHLQCKPGEAPYLRGLRLPAGPKRWWEACQEIAAERPSDFNTALLAGLKCGQDSAALTPDQATRAGLDPDEAPAGTVGLEGVSIADGHDLATALAGVDFTAVPVHVRAGADALPLAALFLELARERSFAWEKLSGSMTADPLGEWIEHGSLPASLDQLYDSLAGWTSWAAGHAPQLRTIGVNGAVWGDAGGTAVQELAFALAAAVEYLRTLDGRGVRPATAAPRMRFRFTTGPQFFTEIAKFRAFRPLWARVLSAFGAEGAAAGGSTVHARTVRWNKTLLDPHVNMLRVTTEALSAVLGGVDSLHIAPFDEVTGATDDFSRRIARNLHALLAEEFHFTGTTDPAGGSWYAEKLTDDLARKAWALFQDIEKRGGLAAALQSGHPQQLVAAATTEKNDAVTRRRLGLVGTNLFPNLKEKPLAPHGLSSGLQSIRARAIRDRRGPAPAPVAAPAWPARFAAALAAARGGATVGQLARLARGGMSAQPVAVARVAPWRAALSFENLRLAAGAFTQRTGSRPRVFVAKIGPVLQHKARADFTAGFFGVGGFEPIAKQTFDTAESAALAAVASGAPIAVLCSTDDTYPALVPVFVKTIKAAKPGFVVVLAGLPADPAQAAAFKQDGIDEFIHVRANVCEILARFLGQIGALS